MGANPPRGRRFEPGQSGNRSGRPKQQNWLVMRVREITPRILEELERIAFHDRDTGNRIKALTALLDRAYGKPKVSVEVASTSHNTFVVRAPMAVSTDHEWEERWAGWDEHSRDVAARRALAPPAGASDESEAIPSHPPILGNPRPGPSEYSGSKLPRRKQGHTLQPDPTNEYSLPTDIYDLQTGMFRIRGTSL